MFPIGCFCFFKYPYRLGIRMLEKVPQSTLFWMTRRFPFQQLLDEQSTFRYLALRSIMQLPPLPPSFIRFQCNALRNLVWSGVANKTLKLLARLENEKVKNVLVVLACFDLYSLFQTLYVNDEVLLCDCPGLVFPSFVSTKAEMILNGILPIDQMRDHVPAVSLISFSIAQPWLRAWYLYSLFKRTIFNFFVAIHSTKIIVINNWFPTIKMTQKNLINGRNVLSKWTISSWVVLLTFCNSQAINLRLGQ